MHLENVVFDAVEPQRLGRFWEAVVGGERLTDELGGFETRLTVEGGPGRGPLLELVPEGVRKGGTKNRLHLDVRLEPDDDPDSVAARIRQRGGDRLHTDWGEFSWRSCTDPSGNESCVLPARP